LDFQNFNFSTVRTVKRVGTALLCPILSKLLQPWLRYRDFSIFQDGGRRHLGFSKFKFFNGRNGQEDQTASLCQILSKSLEPRPRYGDFRFFKMAAAAILDF